MKTLSPLSEVKVNLLVSEPLCKCDTGNALFHHHPHPWGTLGFLLCGSCHL